MRRCYCGRIVLTVACVESSVLCAISLLHANQCTAVTHKTATTFALQIIQTFPHMHTTGAAFSTRIISGGRELAPLDRLNFYDFDMQVVACTFKLSSI